MKNHAQYNVSCTGCGRVWSPPMKSPLWWKALKRAEEGYLDALGVTPQECGCETETVDLDAPYRVKGFNDLCEDFDYPFESLVAAAQLYRELRKDYSSTVFFVDTRARRSQKPSRVEKYLGQW